MYPYFYSASQHQGGCIIGIGEFTAGCQFDGNPPIQGKVEKLSHFIYIYVYMGHRVL